MSDAEVLLPHGGVLVVDDEADLRELICELLHLDGFPTLEAEHGAAALALLRAGARPCVVLLDLCMPVMDGYSFLAARHSAPGAARLPVVLVTAAPTVTLAAPDAVAALVHKPFAAADLIAPVRRLCRCRPAGREDRAPQPPTAAGGRARSPAGRSR